MSKLLSDYRHRAMPRLTFVIMTCFSTDMQKFVSVLFDIMVDQPIKLVMSDRRTAMLAPLSNVCADVDHMSHTEIVLFRHFFFPFLL
jgi:hypothetical protein